MGPFLKLHSSVTVQYRPRASEKELPKGPSWVQPAQPPLQDLSRQSGVPSSWRTWQYPPQTGAVTIGELDPGKVASGSLTYSLFSHAD